MRDVLKGEVDDVKEPFSGGVDSRLREDDTRALLDITLGAHGRILQEPLTKASASSA